MSDAINIPTTEEHEQYAELLLVAASYTVDGDPEFDGDPANTQRLQAAQVHATLAANGRLRAIAKELGVPDKRRGRRRQP